MGSKEYHLVLNERGYWNGSVARGLGRLSTDLAHAIFIYRPGVAELADARDSKSRGT
jgi:hypothetical protein